LVSELDNHFQFEVFLDQQYPFAAPRVHCLTKFTNIIDIYDGKDIYKELMTGEEWRVAKNIHEIISSIPDFIEATK
jgi:ubiquitin-protein ligase